MQLDSPFPRAQIVNLPPKVWASPATDPLDATLFADIRLEIAGLTVPFTLMMSTSGVTYDTCYAYDKTGTPVSTIAANGNYRLLGPGFFKLLGGAATTVTVSVGG